jgi:hypothetical protein
MSLTVVPAKVPGSGNVTGTKEAEVVVCVHTRVAPPSAVDGDAGTFDAGTTDVGAVYTNNLSPPGSPCPFHWKLRLMDVAPGGTEMSRRKWLVPDDVNVYVYPVALSDITAQLLPA